jgi:hypothetical protein
MLIDANLWVGRSQEVHQLVDWGLWEATAGRLEAPIHNIKLQHPVALRRSDVRYTVFCRPCAASVNIFSSTETCSDNRKKTREYYTTLHIYGKKVERKVIFSSRKRKPCGSWTSLMTLWTGLLQTPVMSKLPATSDSDLDLERYKSSTWHRLKVPVNPNYQ